MIFGQEGNTQKVDNLAGDIGAQQRIDVALERVFSRLALQHAVLVPCSFDKGNKKKRDRDLIHGNVVRFVVAFQVVGTLVVTSQV